MILDAPDATSMRGLRDRAILSVGFQAGPRRSEIASLLMKDFHNNAGYKSLHFIRNQAQLDGSDIYVGFTTLNS